MRAGGVGDGVTGRVCTADLHIALGIICVMPKDAIRRSLNSSCTDTYIVAGTLARATGRSAVGRAAGVASAGLERERTASSKV